MVHIVDRVSSFRQKENMRRILPQNGPCWFLYWKAGWCTLLSSRNSQLHFVTLNSEIMRSSFYGKLLNLLKENISMLLSLVYEMVVSIEYVNISALIDYCVGPSYLSCFVSFVDGRGTAIRLLISLAPLHCTWDSYLLQKSRCRTLCIDTEIYSEIAFVRFKLL